MKTEKIVISKDFIKRKSFLKTEFKRKIFKSILQNFQINKIIRVEMVRKLAFLKKESWLSRQNNICLLTGRFGGVFKKYTLSRQSIKRVAKFNMLHNTQIKSW